MRIRLRYSILLGVLLLALIGFVPQLGLAQQPAPLKVQKQNATNLLFENVRVFNGTAAQLS